MDPPGSGRGRPGHGRGPSLAVFAAALTGLTVVCGAIFFIAGPAPAGAAIPSDLQEVRLFGEVKTQVDDLEVQAGSVQAQIDALDLELEKASEEYNRLQVRLDELNVQMAGLRRDLDEARSDHAYRIKKLEDRICTLYKAGGRGDELLELLVSADTIEDLINRIRLASSLADQDRRIVENLVDSTGRLDSVLAEIDKAKRDQLSLRRQADDQREQIRAALAGRESTLETIDAEIRAVIEAEAARQEEEQARLQRALTALLNGGQIYEGPLPETDSEILNQFLETAAYYIGIPYVWAGDRPSTGFDCSGFTQYVYAQHGVDLPHFSGFQAEMGIPVALEEIKPGDLVAFGYPVHHVGVYIGDGMFIHAPRTGDVIKISCLSERNNLSAIRRFELQPRNGAPAVW
ncbi:MAG: NlpC/P60 family protein [Actinomycetia bacterium]|nr:NlpC/P60 family protein [Actinomycetes bacterium]